MALSLVVQRQLEKVSNDVIITNRQERMFVGDSKLVEFATDVPKGAKTYTTPLLNVQGRAALITNNSFDVGGVSGFVEERTMRLYPIYIPCEIPFTDMDNAAYAGVELKPAHMELSVQAVYNSLEDVFATGEPSIDMYGLANNPNGHNFALQADGTGSVTQFSAKTPEQRLRDLHAIMHYAALVTRHAYITTRLLVAPSHWPLIAFDILGNAGSTASVLTTFLQNHNINGIKVDVIVCPWLETAGVGGTPLMVAYNPRPDYIKAIKTKGLERRPWIEQLNGTATAYYVSGVGGIMVRQPLSLVYVQGA